MAPSYTAQDLAVYLMSRSVEKGLAKAVNSMTPLKRGYDHLLRAFDGDRCLLVMITDKLMDGGYAREVGVGSKLVTVGVFDVEINQLGGTEQPWKYMYYKRFAQSWREMDYMTYWLGVLADADDAPLHAAPSDDHATWYDVAEEARKKLNEAVKIINARLKENGAIEEWPDLGPPPTVTAGSFVRNPNRLRWGHASAS